MTEEKGVRRWHEIVPQVLGWAVPLLVAWGFAVQRQADLNSVRLDQMERAFGSRSGESGIALGEIRGELANLRELQTRNFNDIVQRLARVEAKVEK